MSFPVVGLTSKKDEKGYPKRNGQGKQHGVPITRSGAIPPVSFGLDVVQEPRVRGFLKRICSRENLAGGIVGREVDFGRETLSPVHHLYIGFRDPVSRKGTQREEIVLPKHRGNEDSPKPGTDQLSVHHDASDPAVTVDKGMDLGHDEHDEHCPGERVLQSSIDLIAFTQRATYELRRHEVGLASSVGSFLERSWLRIQSAFHDCAVARLE